MSEPVTYSIICFFFEGENQVIKTGLTLEEAQEHCRDPETSLYFGSFGSVQYSRHESM
jgi:hypothetical protein